PPDIPVLLCPSRIGLTSKLPLPMQTKNLRNNFVFLLITQRDRESPTQAYRSSLCEHPWPHVWDDSLRHEHVVQNPKLQRVEDPAAAGIPSKIYERGAGKG
ncbi:unnamed protein product, partial [Scytosiphon promiscuus]